MTGSPSRYERPSSRFDGGCILGIFHRFYFNRQTRQTFRVRIFRVSRNIIARDTLEKPRGRGIPTREYLERVSLKLSIPKSRTKLSTVRYPSPEGPNGTILSRLSSLRIIEYHDGEDSGLERSQGSLLVGRSAGRILRNWRGDGRSREAVVWPRIGSHRWRLNCDCTPRCSRNARRISPITDASANVRRTVVNRTMATDAFPKPFSFATKKAYVREQPPLVRSVPR